DLVCGVDVPCGRAEGQGERVMVGGIGAAVAAPETHDGPACALARVVQEVADDQPQMSEVPVQHLEEPGALQDEVTETLHAGRFPGWPLGAVDARGRVPEVERVWPLPGEFGQRVIARD